MKRGRLGRLDVVLILGLSLLVTGVFSVAYGRTSVGSWSVPITYRGDSLFLLAYLKAAQDGHVRPGASLTVPELNAPFGANWNDHPRTVRTAFFAAGLLARVVGLFVAINLLLLLAHVLAASSFYVTARVLGSRLEWALAGGLTYGLAHYFFWRTLDHLDLVLAWHIPLCVLVGAWAFSRRGVVFGSKRFLVCAAVVVVTGLQNPYYACLFGQFLVLACVAQAIRRAGMRQVVGPAALAALLVLVFAADNAGSLLYQWQHGTSAGASRPYGNLERFSLKPLELLIPEPGFGLAHWGELARVHWEGRIYKGEGGSQYLGLVAAATLLWLAGATVVGLWARPAKAPPPAALAIAWVVAFSSLGGINQLAGLVGFRWLRGTNRFSIWILALVLLFLCTRKVKVRAWSVAIATAVAAVAILDQVPLRGGVDEIAKTRAAIESDRGFTHIAEASLPDGAMLFNLPVTEFPEGRPTLGAKEYDNLRPYLFSAQLRFSFGTDRGRPRDAWQQEMAARAPSEIVQGLETCGFDGIVVNRRAYPAGAQALLDEMRQAGGEVLIPQPGADFALVRLGSLRLARGPSRLASLCGAVRAAPLTARVSRLTAR